MHIVLHQPASQHNQSQLAGALASWDECVDFDPVVRCASGSWYARPISLRVPIPTSLAPLDSTPPPLYDDHRRHRLRQIPQVSPRFSWAVEMTGKFSREFAAAAACNYHHQGSRNIVSCQYFDSVRLVPGFVDSIESSWCCCRVVLIGMHAAAGKVNEPMRCYFFAASLSLKK